MNTKVMASDSSGRRTIIEVTTASGMKIFRKRSLILEELFKEARQNLFRKISKA